MAFTTAEREEIRDRVLIKLPRQIAGLERIQTILSDLETEIQELDDIYEQFFLGPDGRVKAYEEELKQLDGTHRTDQVDNAEVEASAGGVNRLMPAGNIDPERIEDVETIALFVDNENDLLTKENSNIGFTLAGSGTAVPAILVSGLTYFLGAAFVDTTEVVRDNGVVQTAGVDYTTNAAAGEITFIPTPVGPVDSDFTVDTTANEVLRQVFITDEVAALDAQIAEIANHNGFEDAILTQKNTARSNALASSPNAARQTQITARQAEIATRATAIGPLGANASEFYDMRHIYLILRLTRVGGTLQRLEGFTTATTVFDGKLQALKDTRSVEAAVAEDVQLEEENDTDIPDMQTELTTDVDGLGLTPIKTQTAEFLVDNLEDQKEAVDAALEEPGNYNASEITELNTELSELNVRIPSIDDDANEFLQYLGSGAQNTKSISLVLFKAETERQLADAYILAIDNPDITIVSGINGIIDVAPLEAIRAPQITALQDQINVLVDQLETETDENTITSLNEQIDDLTKQLRALYRVTVELTLVENEKEYRETITFDTGQGDVLASPVKGVLSPAGGFVTAGGGDGDVGEIGGPLAAIKRIFVDNGSSGAQDVDYKSNTVTLNDILDAAEQATKASELTARLATIVARRAEINDVLDRRNLL